MHKKEGGDSFAKQVVGYLLDGPASINDVCKDLEIAWATAKSGLEEMKERGEVKEIISNPKIRIFKLTNDPAFYGVPLTKEQKNNALFLFNTIKEHWKKTEEAEKKPLLATTLQKIAVDVAIKYKEMGKDTIPSAQFHYGKVVPIFETSASPFDVEKPKDHLIIVGLVEEEITKHKNNALDEMNDQYAKHDMLLYQAKQKFKTAINKNDKNKLSDIESTLVNVLMNWPVKNQDSQIFSLFTEYLGDVHGLILTKSANDNIDKINETFDVLWDLLTTDLFFRDMETQINKEKKEIFDYIKSYQILSKKVNAEERINYLKLFINLEAEIEMPMDEESVAIRRILAEGAEEG